MRTNKKKDTIIVIELIVLITLWCLVFAGPLIFQLINEDLAWEEVFKSWKRLFPFLLLSLFNHFVLFPFLFVKKSKLSYFIASAITIATFSVLLFKLHKPPVPNHPPMAGEEFHRPPPPGHRPPERRRPDANEPRPNAEPPKRGRYPTEFPPGLTTALIGFLILGFDTGLRGAFRWTRSEQERDKLEKEKVKTELAFLRNQVNPHFLMNTLNNIHALIDFDTDEAKETVIQLSKLMRYLLYDTERDLIPIKEEMSFIKSYVDLMIMRLSAKVKVTTVFDVKDEQRSIPPLLFTSLIENAFKYGVSHRMDTFIDIKLNTTDTELTFDSSNSIAQKKKETTVYSGIGLDNTMKRLEILYGSTYTMNISTENDIFSVHLKIPL